MPKSSLADLIEDTLDTRHLTQEELAELLSARLGTQVTRTRLIGWLRGAEPRMDDGWIREALDEIREQEPEKKYSVNVGREQVKREVERWLKAGLTRKQIQLAAEMPQSTLSAWERGEVDVLRRRFDRVRAMVTLWTDHLKAMGKL